MMYYNPTTKRQVDAVRSRLPHALLLTGAEGSGLRTTAQDIAGHTTPHIVYPLNTKGEHDSTTGSIRVEQVRSLYETTRGKSRSRRIIIVDDADRMNATAQNAFLKLLEEPTEATHFILTSHKPEQLLPTILSRVQTVRVLPISEAQTIDLLTSTLDKTVRAQMMFLAAGLPAELTKLMQAPRYFDSQAQLVRDAQILVGGNRYARIAKAYQYASDREKSLQLLRMSKRVIEHMIKRDPNRQTIRYGELLAETIQRIEGQANTRIQLLRFVI